MKRLFAAAALAAIWAGAAPAMAQSYVIKFAHSLSNTEPAHLAAEYFAKNVGSARTGRSRSASSRASSWDPERMSTR